MFRSKAFRASLIRARSAKRIAAVVVPPPAISTATASPAAPTSAAEAASRRVIVQFRAQKGPTDVAIRSRLLGNCCGAGVRSVQPFVCGMAVLEGVGAPSLRSGAEPEAALREAVAAAAGSSVASVEPDMLMRAQRRQVLPWGMSVIAAPAARKPYRLRNRSLGNVNADVFVLDTGVQKRHPDLNVVQARSFVSWEANPWDLNGHGTAVAGVIGARDNRTHVVGVAPGVRIHSLKVLDRNGEGTLSGIVAAVEHMIRWKRAMNRRVRNAVVANLSLGGFVGTTAYTALDVALRRAVQAGITVVVAAGNEGDDAGLYTPAHCREAICVGATDRSDTLTPWSNWGPFVHVHAPGEGITTTSLGAYLQNISGTSFAAPHTAGAAALWLSRRRTNSPSAVRGSILRLSRNVVRTGSRASTTRRRLYVLRF